VYDSASLHSFSVIHEVNLGLALRVCFPSNGDHAFRKETEVKRLSMPFLLENSRCRCCLGNGISQGDLPPVRVGAHAVTVTTLLWALG
jgi:hypothetical protein